MGQVSIKIDGNGNATAELVNTGAVAVPSTFADKNAAITALKADFGFSSVDDGSASWSLVDLNKVHAALSRLPGADRAGLPFPGQLVEDPGDDGPVAAVGEGFLDGGGRRPPDPQRGLGRADLFGYAVQHAFAGAGDQQGELHR